ncbi:MAG TPA: hypothetical protein VN667_02525, partial [Burkholderiales bacterium]|nr:hypothetical protein [Burkholderiales bacterium]
MTLSGADLRPLRWPLAIAVLLALAGIGVTVMSERQLDAARKARDLAHIQRIAAQERVTKATDEEREIRQNLGEYQKMVDAGMVGRANRLDLIERISDIKKQRKLFEMHYNIEAQKPLDYAGISSTGGMDFVTNRMQLTMLLLHEDDFLGFLRDLGAGSKA